MASTPRYNAAVFSRGPVAQLGARFHGMEEVVGSIPTRSTKTRNNNYLARVHSLHRLIATRTDAR